MIKAHPPQAMLRAFVAGELPLPLAVGVSAHCELCAECGARLDTCEGELAALHLADPVQAGMPEPGVGPELGEEEPSAPRFAAPLQGRMPELDAMLAQILCQPILSGEESADPAPGLRVAGLDYRLPRALARYHTASWRRLGSIRHHRLPLAERGARASLIHVEAGGQIPEHLHRGFELTLLLAGHIQDGALSYQAGDFIWCEAGQIHSPHTPDGCLCYTVLDAPVQFTRGMSRLLNGMVRRHY